MTLLEWTPTKGWNCAAPYFARKARQEASRNENNVDSVRQASWIPATDIYDTEEHYVFQLEIPGFTKDDLSIEFKEGILTVKGERKEEEMAEDVRFHRTERRKGSFARSFRLPKKAQIKKIDAALKNGILKLMVVKPEEQKPREIPITVN